MSRETLATDFAQKALGDTVPGVRLEPLGA